MKAVSAGYKTIQKELKEFLKEFGFKVYKSSTLYRITENGFLQFLDFQKGYSYLNGQMTMNVVVQGLFVPGCGFDILQPGGRIGYFIDGTTDKWWNYDNEVNVNQSTKEMKLILQEVVLPFFKSFEDIDNIPKVIEYPNLAFVWRAPITFIDKGYFLLKARCYDQAIKCWEQYQTSKVPKFKTVKKLVELKLYNDINDILEENCRMAKTKLAL